MLVPLSINFSKTNLSIKIVLSQYFLKQINFHLIYKYENRFIIIALEFILTCICSALKNRLTNKRKKYCRWTFSRIVLILRATVAVFVIKALKLGTTILKQ